MQFETFAQVPANKQQSRSFQIRSNQTNKGQPEVLRKSDLAASNPDQ